MTEETKVTNKSPLGKTSIIGSIVGKLMNDAGPRVWKQHGGPSGVAKDDGPEMGAPEMDFPKC